MTNRFETFFLIFLSAGVTLFLLRLRLKDQKYFHKKTSEVLSQKLKEEIEQERAESIRKREKFSGLLAEKSNGEPPV